MAQPPVISTLSDSELRDLVVAKSLLEQPRLAIRLAGVLGSPVDMGFALLPKGWSETINKSAHAALLRALNTALATLGKRTRPLRELFHKTLAGVSGGIGGAFGLLALPLELPISTTIMLRSIADIARHEGHDLRLIETKLACLEVFALGGGKRGDTLESAYWVTRAAISRSITDAASYLARKGAVRESAPAIARLITEIASRFGIIVSEEIAAKAVPVIGAVGGSVVNLIFIGHFQEIARGHFIVKRLEAVHGSDLVREAYDKITIPRA